MQPLLLLIFIAFSYIYYPTESEGSNKASVTWIRFSRLLSAVRIEQLGSQWTDFIKFDIWEFVSKICRENSSFIKIWQEYRILYMKTNIHF